MKKFKVDKQTPILLYGAASIGLIACKNLCESGYNVNGFIDKRAQEMSEVLGFPVYTLKEISKWREKKNTIIIVSVKNVFEHTAIAYDLCKMGFKRIVYKSILVLEGSTEDNLVNLSQAYDSILDNTFIDCELPLSLNISFYSFSDEALICETNESITAYVPIELIFTNRDEKDRQSEWNDIPICMLYPHIEFFRCLSGDEKCEYNHYLQFCVEAAKRQGNIQTTDAWKRNVITNRAMIYAQMEKAYNINEHFFLKAPATGTWNEKGYFNLTGGKHRVTFLLSKQKDFIPLRVTKEDYNRWMEYINFTKIIKEIKCQEIKDIPCIISHPRFFGCSFRENRWTRKQVATVLFFICSKYQKPEQWKMLDIFFTNQNMVLSEILSKMGICINKERKGTYEDQLMSMLVGDETKKIVKIDRKVDILFIDDFKELKCMDIKGLPKVIIGFTSIPDNEKQLVGYQKIRVLSKQLIDMQYWYLGYMEKIIDEMGGEVHEATHVKY